MKHIYQSLKNREKIEIKKKSRLLKYGKVIDILYEDISMRSVYSSKSTDSFRQFSVFAKLPKTY